MDADVVVVGAGPTGLLLAGDLAEAGVSVTVLERRTRESNVTRAFAVHARTMEELEIRGLARELAGTGVSIDVLRLFDRVSIDLSRLPSEFNSLLITPQYETERVLQRRADALGVRTVRGAEMTDLSQDEHGVDVVVRGEQGPAAIRARYVVGADGASSAVRRAIGLPFPGRTVLTSIMVADVQLSSPPGETLSVDAVGDAFAFIAPFGDGWYRVFGWNRDNQVDERAALELTELQEVTRRALGTDFGMHDPRWLSRFRSDERQVPHYRVGRVFLAGDAAHCHTPAGGQGMNTGMQDAANLGWKLAAAVHGWGDERLLDSYHDERYPVGRQVLRSSGAIIRMALIRPRWGRWMRNAVGQLLLAIPPIAAAVAGRISGIATSYPAPPGAGRGVGSRVPNITLRSGNQLYDALLGGRFVLLGVDAAGVDRPPQVDAAEPALPTRQLMLVRPDGYLSWVGAADEFPKWARGYFRQPSEVASRTVRSQSLNT